MRDGPFHTSTILAGLWGGNNYLDMEKAVEIRKRLLDVPARQWNIISSITSYYDHHHDHYHNYHHRFYHQAVEVL